jgi:hypothetical protein
MPLFSLLRDRYPTDRYPCLNAGGQPAWPNQCAIRMSVALVGAGVSLESFGGGKCSHGHARLAQQLADWLRHGLAEPRIVSSTGEAALRQEIAQQQGIIFFQDCFARPGEESLQGDHIDVWDRGVRIRTFCWFPPRGRSSQVWFWQLTG